MSLSRRDFLKGPAPPRRGGVAAATADRSRRRSRLRRRRSGSRRPRPSPGVCPYCAVGCAQLIYAKDDKIIDIEGDPDTPHTEGALCPKGASTIQLSNNPLRPTKPLYRAPGTDKWEEKPIDWMYEQIAKRYYDTREKHFIEKEKDGRQARHRQPLRGHRLARLGLHRQRGVLPPQQARTGRSASSTTSIRPESDTPPRSQLWGPRSGGAR